MSWIFTLACPQPHDLDGRMGLNWKEIPAASGSRCYEAVDYVGLFQSRSEHEKSVEHRLAQQRRKLERAGLPEAKIEQRISQSRAAISAPAYFGLKPDIAKALEGLKGATLRVRWGEAQAVARTVTDPALLDIDSELILGGVRLRGCAVCGGGCCFAE